MFSWWMYSHEPEFLQRDSNQGPSDPKSGALTARLPGHFPAVETDTFANSVDPDEMACYEPSHLYLHWCLILIFHLNL